MPFLGHEYDRRTRDKGFATTIEYLRRNDSPKSASQKRPPLAGAYELFTRDRKEKFEQITIEERETSFVGRTAGQGIRSELPLE